MRKLTVLLTISLLLLSCNSNLRVEKRRYMKGYHVQSGKKKPEAKKLKNHLFGQEKTDSPVEANASEPAKIHKNNITESDNYNTEETENAITEQRHKKQLPENEYNNSKTQKNHTENVVVNKEEKNSGNDDGLMLLFAGLLGLVTFGAFKVNLAGAKKISLWAKANPRKTMVFINLAHLALITGGLFVGRNLHDFGFAVSDTSTNVLLGIGGLAALLYPIKKATSKIFKGSYLRRKAHDLALVLCGFLLMTSVGNQAAADRNFSAPVTAVFEFIDQSYQQDAIQEQELSEPGISKQQKEPSPGEIILKIFLTLLVIALFVGAAIGIAVASCALSCNGQTALAAIVGIGGGVLIIALLVVALRAIWKDWSSKPNRWRTF